MLFLTPNDDLYGSARVLLSLLAGLDRTRFEPVVVVGDDLTPDGPLTHELRALGIRALHLPLACIRRSYLSPNGIPWFLKRLRRSVSLVSRLIAAEGIDLVYSNTLVVWTGALAAARTRRPHIWHAHEIVEHPTALRLFLQRFVPHFSHRVVCVSRATSDALLVDPRARAKGIVLYNGLDAGEWLAPTGRRRVRAELGCAEDEVLVGMVGRLSTFKAPDLFVEAAARLLVEQPSLRFFIAGEPIPGQTDVLERVRHLIAESPAPERIHLLGFRRDVPDLTAALDIQVVPSRWPEPFPLVVLQGMAAGKPIVAADVGAIREAIDDGRTGVVVPREDSGSLAAAIGALAADPVRRAALGDAARERILSEFTLDRQVAAFEHLLAHEGAAARGPLTPASERGVAVGARPIRRS